MTTAAAAHQFDPEIAAALAPAACAAGAPVIDRGDRRIAGRSDQPLVHRLAPAVSGSRLGLSPSMPGSGDIADRLTRRAATASVWQASVSATIRETPAADEEQALRDARSKAVPLLHP